MSEIDQQFIEYVVKSLVGKPEAVHIERRIDEKGVLLELTVDPEDLGRVIGKRGATAQSLRTLLRALGTKNDARYNLKIIDNGPQGQGGGQSAVDASGRSSDDSAAKDESENQIEKPADNLSQEAEAPGDTAASSDEDTSEESDRLSKTRAELAELDDLDV